MYIFWLARLCWPQCSLVYQIIIISPILRNPRKEVIGLHCLFALSAFSLLFHLPFRFPISVCLLAFSLPCYLAHFSWLPLPLHCVWLGFLIGLTSVPITEPCAFIYAAYYSCCLIMLHIILVLNLFIPVLFIISLVTFWPISKLQYSWSFLISYWLFLIWYSLSMHYYSYSQQYIINSSYHFQLSEYLFEFWARIQQPSSESSK